MMPWDLSDADGNRYRLPASLAPARLHVGGAPRIRAVRGYGNDQWFSVQDGIREPETFNLVGVLATDRDDAGTQALIDGIVAAAAAATRLYHVDHAGLDVRYLPLLGSLPATVQPEGVNGAYLRVLVPLVPSGSAWLAAEESDSGYVPPEPPDPTLVYDTFTDANSTALSSHTPDIAPVGASWALDAAGLAINTNRVVNTIDAFRYGVIDSGASDATITAKLTLGTIAGRYAGFIFRYIDANNYWQAQIDAFGDYIAIVEVTGGSGTIRTTQSVSLGTGPYEAIVTLNGTSIQVTANGATASYTSSQHQAATKHGILLRSNAAGSVDDFKVEEL